ncbi:MAG: hypothetical protein KDD76_02395 [Rickettsiales bacterium]|nr:hypothetical protein [Rickettsiales bacterium]
MTTKPDNLAAKLAEILSAESKTMESKFSEGHAPAVDMEPGCDKHYR